MDWFSAPDYWFTRAVIERSLALVYLIAFVAAIHQFPALLGDRGLMPARRYLKATTLSQAPSLFRLGYSDRALIGLTLQSINSSRHHLSEPYEIVVVDDASTGNK